jgi:hypothetical protein
LAKCRLKKEKDQYKEILCSVLLLRKDITGNWSIFKGICDWRMNLSLVSHCPMPAGQYMIVIDPIWNEFALKNKEYQKVVVDVYAPNHAINAFDILLDTQK